MLLKYCHLLIVFGSILCFATRLSATDAETLKSALDVVYQDEFDARSRYEGVLEDFGSVKPFSNIVLAEGRHMAALEQLYGLLKIEKPILQPFGDSPFSTISAACIASVEAEIRNVQLYDKFLEIIAEEQVRSVFQLLRDASADRHLPAFRRCQ